MFQRYLEKSVKYAGYDGIKSSGKFLSFYNEIMDAQHFSFYDQFCSIKIKIATFDRLGFTFV